MIFSAPAYRRLGREKTHTKVMKVRIGHKGNMQVVQVGLFPIQAISVDFKDLGDLL